VCLQGQDVQGRGVVAEDAPHVVSVLAAYFVKAPQYARYLNIALDAEGKPEPEDIAQAAHPRVVVQVKLN